MRTRDEYPAGTDGTAPEAARTEREFMDALRALRRRSGLSYRDVALRMSQVAPRHAMAKSTLAALFAQDGLPRRPGQLTAIVEVLTAELTGPADAPARYRQAWTRLVTARAAQPGAPAGPPVVPPPRQPAPLYCPPAYRGPSGPRTPPDEARSDFDKAGGLWPLLVGGTVLSVITWLPFAGGPVPFWAVWLAWCGPLLLITAIAALFRRPHGSRSAELPAEYLRYERRATPRRL